MKLYYHRTDGGAEYYSTTHAPGSEEGTAPGIIMRTDGGEIEILADRIAAQGLQLIIKGDPAPLTAAERAELQEQAEAAYLGSDETNPDLLVDPLDPVAEIDADGRRI